ncbi:hypothetical protein [Blastopirellula marina]|uniref:Uncharacterized protein n=1 Tax=Blastopirellula marina TaxID=124 RepID=A0A2S8G220_9BACT|nr:hypothetical protein [Blastopirellula marina]PQO38495.1 hypothetical protein C5Y98_10595 [Blastopirellula marina]PTL45152.1 hypothetical protein C5Y97_10605 [Blastopirellula marina]
MARSNQPKSEIPPWYFWIWLVVLVPLMVAIGFVLIPLAVIVHLFMLPVSIVNRYRCRRHDLVIEQQLAQAGRVVTIEQILRHLERGEGTLIFEARSAEDFGRTWWTPDGILQESSISLSEESADDIAARAQFAELCYHKYLNENSGTAKLISQKCRINPKLYPRLCAVYLDHWSNDYFDIEVAG